MDSLVDLVDKSERKALLKIRKTVFEKMVEEESYQLKSDNIIIMKGAKPNETAYVGLNSVSVVGQIQSLGSLLS